MRKTSSNPITLRAVVLGASLWLTASAAFAASTVVNLTAQRMTAAMPDGSSVPMWGYCTNDAANGAALGGGQLRNANVCSTTVGTTTTANTVWAPGPTIVVPYGNSLQIVLTDGLPVETSLTIVGQYGGGIGHPVMVPGPSHPAQQSTTWPSNASSTFTPPVQGLRVRSFVPEAAAGGTQTYNWPDSQLNPSSAPLKPGTYVYETATHPSLQEPMGLYGVIVVTQLPVAATSTTPLSPGLAYPAASGTATTPPGANPYGVPYAGAPYDADAVYLLSEIDPVQNAAVDAAAAAGTAEDLISTDPSCVQAQHGGSTPCYPPAVNYRPTYFLINGSPFDASNPAATSQVVADAAASGNILLRFANAGLRTHVPTINGLQMAVLSQDGNLGPGLPRVQSEVNLVPGRTADVLIQPASNGTVASASAAATAPTQYTDASFAWFDRALDLATNNVGNGGMHGYLAIGTPTTTVNAMLQTQGVQVAAAVGSLTCNFSVAPNVLPTFSATLSASTPGCAATASGQVPTAAAAPANGSVSWNGTTFTYTPFTAPIAANDSFVYCTSAASPICSTINLATAPETANIVAPAANPAFTSNVAKVYRAIDRATGVLAGYSTTDHYLVEAVAGAITGDTCSGIMNGDGSFSVVHPSDAAGTCTFPFSVYDPRNPTTQTTGQATVTFPSPSNLQVTVADALNGSTGSVAPITDYMWIIEEDQTFHNPQPGTALAQANGSAPPPTLATSFHRSHMPVVAVGCTGPLSCGDGAGGQTIQGSAVPLAYYSTPADVALDPNKYYFISVLPGDAANPFINGYGLDPTQPQNSTCLVKASNPLSPMATDCGHSIGGAEVPAVCTTNLAGKTTCASGLAPVTVKVEPNPLKPAALSVYIFEDNSPTNNDYDANEVGLGGFSIIVNDVAGRSGDPIGQITYDAYNMPLTNSLLGVRGCPNETPAGRSAKLQTNLVGVVYTCPDGDRQIADVTVTSTLIKVRTSVRHQFAQSVQGANPTIDISGLGVASLNGSFPITVTGPFTFTYANPGVKAGTKVLVVGASMARDATTYQLAGQALINNIMPGRFDVLAHPGADREGAGENWYQVSTLEGTPGQDAFTKSGEPNFFQEFGPPGFHTFIGWVNPAHLADQNKIALAQAAAAGQTQTTTISGRVTSLHMSRPIMETLWDSASNAAIGQSNCFVAINQTGETGNDVGFTSCDADGKFTLPAVPSGQQYEIVVWDQWLDQIIAFKNINANQVNAGTLDMGDIPVFSWFTRVEASVYIDSNGNGVRDPSESGVPLVPVTIRFRDGSISNILTTDGNGDAVFNELFPLFNWYVIESDQTRYNYTGVNVVADAGGLPDCVTYTAANSPPFALTKPGADPSCANATVDNTGNPDVNAPLGARTGGVLNSSYVWTDPTTGQSFGAVPAGASTSTSRVDPATTIFNGVFQGLQGFINQTEMIDWGRRNFAPGENGGISGLVIYTSTRGFDDPGLEDQFLWEPGIPRVKLNLYQEITNADGTTGYQYVTSTTSTSWDDWANGAHLDAKGNTVPNMVCPGQDSNDPYLPYSLGTGNQFKCYDGFHNWNQVQPAVYDGYYAFSTLSDGVTPLPAGKYVVEVVPPPGYEIVKEEDKNILIGDQWVAPPATQFGALSNVFILPDQATLSQYYNANNPGGNNPTTSLGFTAPDQLHPDCVGDLHQVPDYLSLFPVSGQVAPFAGAMKPLCDRKEVVLGDQMSAGANFFLFTTTPRASHYTGLILDDAAAEINSAAPDFGEKFAASYAPVSIRDFNGVEISRVYSDEWGTYNGLAPSTWQVNVPNPAGYSPNMLVTCMNDPGPITDPATGQQIQDPLYNPQYSNFCYTNPFMPGMTVYLDTPVLPVAAFAAGYNPPDCALPAATPAISRVDGDGVGPWVAAADGTHKITITALGDVQVSNPNYQGPSATTAPWNTRTITRHYGFGATQGSGYVTVNGKKLTINSWSDSVITAWVPSGVTSGELSIVSGNGQDSVDAVTLTVGGPKPAFVVEPATSVAQATGNAHPIQDAIDAAKPGDLIIVDAGSYPELVVMWKPVRLQGVGAASVVINAAKYPTQKLQTWRPIINRLFGVDTVAGNQVANSQVDALPNQEITGGIVLLEPTVLATEEGAGITVLGKDPNAVGPDGRPDAACPGTKGKLSSVLTSSYPDQVLFPPTSNSVKIVNTTTLMSDSNFTCVPAGFARIDGLSVTGGDAGGGIYVNGWAHGLEISNNRVYGNAGAYNGGIRVGVPYLQGLTPTAAAADGSVFGYDKDVYIHHNEVTNNGTVEANPGTVSAANSTGAGGGLSICTGTDNYRVNYNFICGNYSSGDGGGIGHLGVSNGGTISHNTIVFNQSYQQTAQVNGGGIVVEGELGTVGGTSLGTGSLTIDGNVIRGNFAEGGDGGGIRLQQVNGADVTANPANATGSGHQPWYHVTVTNNMITNNVAGWGGGGISVADALDVRVENNTIANNDSVGIVGTMIGSNPLSWQGQTKPLSNTTGYPSPAGVSVDRTTGALLTGMSSKSAAAYRYANVDLFNDVIWHNRSFFFAVTSQAIGVNGAVIPANTLCPSNTVLDAYNPAGSCKPLAVQTVSGQCMGGAQYWDLGTTDDASATPGSNNSGAWKLSPTYSVFSESTSGYTGTGNKTTQDPGFKIGYCNGARANPAFIFEPGQPYLDPATQNLTAGATLDEAGNFVDVRFGPLYLYDPTTSSNTSAGTMIGDYHLAGANGVAYNDGGAITGHAATLSSDIDGDSRPQFRGTGSGVDIGADEIANGQPASGLVFAAGFTAGTGNLTNGTLAFFGSGTVTVTVTNTGTATARLSRSPQLVGNTSARYSLVATGTTCTAGTSLQSGSSCQVVVHFAANGSTHTATLQVNYTAGNITQSPAQLPLTGK